MNQATPAVQSLARLLLAQHANGGETADAALSAAQNVFDMLRSSLVKLVGVAGFQALLARALGIAKTEVNWLGPVQVRADATLDGFCEAAVHQPTERVTAGSAVLLAQVLGLLVTLIGQDLTMRLMRDVWPAAKVEVANTRVEETPA